MSTRPRRPPRTTVRAAVLVLLVALLGGTSLLGAAVLPGGSRVPLGAATAAAQTGVQEPQFVALRVLSQSPSAVTSAGPSTVSVTGQLVNVGDRDVRDLEVRLQRAPALRSEGDLRDALRTTGDTYEAVTTFERVTDLLAPGEAAPFTVTAQLTGTGADGLDTPGPGTYPFVVNVNGQPDFGNVAKLDEASFLLPVLGLPPGPGEVPGDAGAATPGTTTPPATPPVATTLLWPLADEPKLVPSTAGPPTLVDDDLARSFGPGGRLDGLLSAVETRTAPAADPTGQLGRSLCLAVDPDLLVTAQAMAAGYQVRDAGGGVSEGTGARAASSWLDRLRGVAAGTCVQPLPWAQADLDALTRADLPGLRELATTAAAQTVATVLGVPVTEGTTWPTTGSLTPATAAGLAGSGVSTVLLPADAVTAADDGSPTPGTVSLGSGTSAVLLDPAAATALAAAGDGAADGTRVLRLQDVVGALSFAPIAAGTSPGGLAPRADAPDTTDTTDATDAGVPRTVVVAPPQRWSVRGGEPGEVLDALLRLYDARLATAAPLPQEVASARAAVPAAGTVLAGQPALGGVSLVPVEAPGRAAEIAAQVTRFAASATTDPQLGVTPAQLVAPLQVGLLRGLSALGAPPGTGVDAVGAATAAMTGQVSLVAPTGSYTLASRTSPLLLTVSNELPVAVAVQVRLAGPPGLQTGEVGTTVVPARSNLPLQVPTTVVRVGQFAVDASLVTESGQPVGTQARLQVRSTAYGPATAAVVLGAAVVLVALVARRLLHRLRGQPDRADEGRVPR